MCIQNTFEPEHLGTLITKDYVSKIKRIEVITGTDQKTLIDIYDPLMTGNVGSDPHITGASSNISPVTCQGDQRQHYQHRRLGKRTEYGANCRSEKHFESVTTEPVAMVCLLGTNMDQPGLFAKAIAALAKAEISIIATGAPKARSTSSS